MASAEGQEPKKENGGIQDQVDSLLKEAGMEGMELMPTDEDVKLPKAWKVVAGGKSGGLLVRDGRALASAELPERLSKKALIEEIELVGERLHFFRLTGEGPREGWVSIKQKGSDLVVPAELQEPAEDEWVYSEEQADIDYAICGHIMLNTEGRGMYFTFVEATAQRTDSGQLHIGCLVCAEAGHLTPMLRVAKGLADRDGIWRITIVTNAYGAEKVMGWLTSSPDPTGKIQVVGYIDGWNQDIQELSNKYSQAEDGKLHGLQNDAMGLLAVDCIKSIQESEHPPALYIVDGASNGFWNVLIQLDPFPKTMVSVALVVIASAIYSSHNVPVLFHCFELPPAMEGFKALGKRPERLFPTGIIADEIKMTGLPKELEDFLAESDLPVVYVSMGSQGIFTRDQLRRVSAGLTSPGEWRVIWSLRANQQKLLPGGSAETLGKDFYVSSWLPQAELLLHPKVKAFMSHCGWGATCEAITSCKPVIAFPLFADQNINAFFMELFGMSKIVGWERVNPMDPQAATMRFMQVMALWSPNPTTKRLRDRFTARVLNEDVRSVLNDESYARGAQMLHFYNKRQKGGLAKFSDLVERHARDQPMEDPPKAASAKKKA